MECDLRLVYVTAPDRETADKLARMLVQRRLAACANILPGIQSVYWWEGTVEEADEVALIFKTRADLVEALTAAIVELHPYECPCVVALPILGGNPAFLGWIAKETAAGRAQATKIP